MNACFLFTCLKGYGIVRGQNVTCGAMRDFNNDLGRHYKQATDCPEKGDAADADGNEDFCNLGTLLFNEMQCTEDD